MKIYKDEYNEAVEKIKRHLKNSTNTTSKCQSWRLKGFLYPDDSRFGAGLLTYSPGWFMQGHDVSLKWFIDDC